MAVLDRLCPAATALTRRTRAAIGATLAAVAVVVLATAVNAILGVGGRPAEHALRDWGSSAVYVLVALAVGMRAARVADKRRAWAIFAAGLCSYGVGNVLWSTWVEHLAHPPIPSICDGFWLAFYPLSYVGILGFAHSRDAGRIPAGVWLDGIIAGAGFAAVGAALVFRPVLAAASGNVAAVATELAYPIGDLLLAALLVGLLALRGWRLERAWRALGAGFISLAAADCLYAVQVAHGASTPSALTNLIYVAGTALLGVAAWQPTPSSDRAQDSGRSTLVMPAAFTLAAVGLLQYDYVSHLDPLAFALADTTLAAALIRCALAIRDIRALAEARREAGTDHLTSLPNRRSFMAQSREAIARARSEGSGAAVLMIDLDNFKELNDTLGHSAGDVLLSLIGPRLRDRLRGGDVVARLGGDEFAVVLKDCGAPEGAGAVAKGILGDLRRPFPIADLSLRLTASIGIALFPADGTDEQELLSRADIAMYQAKRARRGFEFYAPDRDTHSTQRLTLATDLARAIERDELEVHFQPKGEVASRAIVGVEALVRWRRADGELVPPLAFLGAAEQAGLSRALTGRVLRATLRQLAGWRRDGFPIHAAVNTTVADLLDLAFPDEVADALARHRLDPRALVLEVTESSVLTDPERITTVLARLRELGVTISLDDFGTGYSSLSHLISLPVSELKIDRSFVAELATGGAGTAVVDAMIGLGHQLGMRVVAEGVEDEVAWSLLAEMGCDFVQGYGLARPLPAGELTARLHETATPRGRVDPVPAG